VGADRATLFPFKRNYAFREVRFLIWRFRFREHEVCCFLAVRQATLQRSGQPFSARHRILAGIQGFQPPRQGLFARVAGAEIPYDWPIDGVDQIEFPLDV
jgi:hypothetical protein